MRARSALPLRWRLPCCSRWSGGAAARVPPSFFGVNPWLSFEGTDFHRLQTAKVHNARTPFFWPTIEPSPGDFHWAATDRFVGTSAVVGVRTLPFLNGSPSWVTSDSRHAPVRSKKARKRWTRFVKAAVERYGRHGKYWRHHPNVPKLPITTWQVWNEENNSHYYSPRPSPRGYAQLVKLAHRAAKSVDRRAKIVIGGLPGHPKPKHSMNSPRFLSKLYHQKRIKRAFNAVAVHPYAPSINNLRRQLSSLHKVMRHHHDHGQIWITEMGWGSAHPSKRWPLLKGVHGQAKMLKRSFRLLLRHRKSWNVKRVYWCEWRDAAPDAPTNCSFCKSAGLFTYDFHPKPSWRAFLKFTRHPHHRHHH